MGVSVPTDTRRLSFGVLVSLLAFTQVTIIKIKKAKKTTEVNTISMVISMFLWAFMPTMLVI